MKNIYKCLSILSISALLVGAILLRFVSLGSLPPGSNMDEVNIGVEALSILQTGRDTWNVWMPRTFHAFGEYKAPGLIYTITGMLHFMPLSTMVTRLPSAVAGLLSTFAIFLIIGKLLPSHKLWMKILYSVIFLLSPWAFGISRQFFEANVGLPFILLGLYFLLNDENKYHAIFAGIFFGISGYFYMSFRYLSIIFILTYGLIHIKSEKSKIKKSVIMMLITILVGFGWSIDYFSQKSLRRLSQYNEYTTFGNSLIVNENRELCYLVSGKNPKIAKICYIFWNKPTVQFSRLSITYLTSISPTSLFLDANNEYTIPKKFGMYIWILMPFYILGIFVLIESWLKKNFDSNIRLLSLWLVLSPIPQIFTTEVSIHRNVVFLALVFPVVILGIDYFYQILVRNRIYRYLITLMLFALMFLYTSQYLLNYFTIFTHSDEIKWNSDKGELWSYINKYDLTKFKVIDNAYLGPMDAAFYQIISTKDIQLGQRALPNSGGWSHLTSAGSVFTGNDISDVIYIDKLLCQRNLSNESINTLIITGPLSQYNDLAVFNTRGYTGVHQLHSIYDLDVLYDHLKRTEQTYFARCIDN